jgi:hypothetical protein
MKKKHKKTGGRKPSRHSKKSKVKKIIAWLRKNKKKPKKKARKKSRKR